MSEIIDPIASAVEKETAQFLQNEQNASNPAAPVAPVTETPVTTTTDQPPVVNTDAQVATPTWNEVEYLKANYGVESAEDIRQRLSSYDALTIKEQEYQTQLADLQKLTPADEVQKFFLDGMKKGIAPEVLSQLYKLKPDEMTDEQRIKYWTQVQKPYLTKDEIDALYARDYVVDEDAIDADQQKVLKGAALKEAGFTAKEALKDYTNKTLNPAASEDARIKEESAKVAQQQLVDGWKRLAPDLTKQLKEIKITDVPITMYGQAAGSEKKFDLNYAIPADISAKYIEFAVTQAIREGYQPTNENMPAILDFAQKQMMAHESSKIYNAFAQQVQTHILNDLENRISNNELTRMPVSIGADGKVNSTEEAVLTQFRAHN